MFAVCVCVLVRVRACLHMYINRMCARRHAHIFLFLFFCGGWTGRRKASENERGATETEISNLLLYANVRLARSYIVPGEGGELL